MKKQIPVNPDVLVWARETAGLSIDEAARRIKKDAEILMEWEGGNGAPTYIQLEKLAYGVYKRPLALFFFPEPPQEETPRQSFRTLPEQEIAKMSSRMKILIRKARVMQTNLIELNEKLNPVEKPIFKAINFDVHHSVERMAKFVREFLGISLEQQVAWKNVNEAFKGWREKIEENGIFVFKDAFRDDNFSGFCLYDAEFPLIYINNSTADARQIFTVFHELAHLLFKTGGVDMPYDNYMNYLTGNDRKIEIICNRFAGAFLVPDSDFNENIAGLTINECTLQNLASHYKVSREVILRKLLDRSIIDQSYYSEKKKEWTEPVKPEKGKGGNYYRNMSTYLSQTYLELAFGKFYQKRISDKQLAEYLGVKAKGLANMENIMLTKGIQA